MSNPRVNLKMSEQIFPRLGSAPVHRRRWRTQMSSATQDADVEEMRNPFGAHVQSYQGRSQNMYFRRGYGLPPRKRHEEQKTETTEFSVRTKTTATD